MGQRSNNATTKNAQIKFRKEECARGAEQGLDGVATKDVKILL